MIGPEAGVAASRLSRLLDDSDNEVRRLLFMFCLV